MKNSIILLLLFIVYNTTRSELDYKLKIRSLENCEENDNEIVDCKTELTNNDGTDVFNAQLSLKVPFDDTFRYSLSIHDPENPRYFMRVYGTPSTDFHYLMPGLWAKITTAAGISNEFPIAAGDYSVENFTISLPDCGFPVTFTSRSIIIARIMYEGVIVICRKFSIEPTPVVE